MRLLSGPSGPSGSGLELLIVEFCFDSLILNWAAVRVEGPPGLYENREGPRGRGGGFQVVLGVFRSCPEMSGVRGCRVQG